MGLRMCSPYRPKNSSYYWVRKRIPEELQPLAKQREFKRSLKTRDPQEARKLAAIVCSEFEQLIAKLRRSLKMNAQDIRGLTGEFFREEVDRIVQRAQKHQWDSEAFEIDVDLLLDTPDASLPLDLTWEEYEELRSTNAARWGLEAVKPILERHGLTPPPAIAHQLGEEVFKAAIKARYEARARQLGDTHWTTPDYAKAALQSSAPLSELWHDYAKASKLAPRTVDSWKTYIKRASDFLKHKPASEVTKQDILAFADALSSGDTKAIPSGKTLTAKTINDNYLAALSALYKWAIERGLLTNDPTKGIKIKARAGEGFNITSYTREQVAAILRATRGPQSSRIKPETANIRRWVPWLCAFTGARIGEILWLKRGDVGFTEGIAYINISPDEDSGARTVKTTESVRSVPLHPAIIKEGFLDYWRSLPSGEAFLFPGEWSDQHGDRTKTPANRLREWLKDTLPNADWQRLNPNHSFRHWLISECRRAKIDSDHARVITGHGFKDSHGKYGPADIPTLYEELALIPSPLDAAPPKN